MTTLRDIISSIVQVTGMLLVIGVSFGAGWYGREAVLASPLIQTTETRQGTQAEDSGGAKDPCEQANPAGIAGDFELDRFFAALGMVESGGKPDAYNRYEDAAGIYQIRPVYVADVNRILGRGEFSLDDRYNVERSKGIVAIYLSYYCTKARLNRMPTVEDLCRTHNGGPSGWKKESTKLYAAKFMRLWNDYADSL